MSYARANKVWIWRKGRGFDLDAYSMNDLKKFDDVDSEVTLYELRELLCNYNGAVAKSVKVLDNNASSTIVWTESHLFGAHFGKLDVGDIAVSSFFAKLRPNDPTPSELNGEYSFIAEF